MNGHAVLVGPTASGKTDVAVALAERVPDLELVSVDSMCVYRGMDIGTAKPTPEQRVAVRVHLIDLVDPGQDYSVSLFRTAARDALSDIESRGKRALLVGGTGLYLRAVIDDLDIPRRFPDVAAQLEREADAPGALAPMHARLATLDPRAAARIVPTNRRRLVRALEVTLGSGRPFSSFGPGLTSYPDTAFSIVGISREPRELSARIARRFHAQMEVGWLDEVRGLARRPEGLGATARQALGYRELLSHVEGGVPLPHALEQGISRTRRYARRQLSWFKRDPRIRWIDGEANPLAATEAALRDWIAWRP